MIYLTRSASIAGLLVIAFAASAPAQQTPQTAVLFQNVSVFDGKSTALSEPTNVLVRGNKIELISAAPVAVDRSANATIVDGTGRTLMPGLIDAHVHLVWESTPFPVLTTSEIGYLNLLAAEAAEKQLLRGFTTVRDAGGPAFALKRAIDEGRFMGPRIYPSGAMISQTSGHADFRLVTALPREPGAPLDYSERSGATAIADGADEVLRKTRENLMRGASQIKLHAGGGVASNYDPVDVSQYTERELRAAVEAAEAWGTYVMVHAFTPRAIRTAINVGVRCIEHSFLMDEATAKLMAERDIWLSIQPFMDDEDRLPFPEGSVNRMKWLQVVAGVDRAYELAKKYKIRTAFGTDSQFDPKLAARNPYPGKLGVVEEGALADLLLVDGDPLANIKLIEDPAKNFVVIMKDGKIYKNTAGQ